MECKFITNGLYIDYFGTAKPCCVFQSDNDYQISNNINQIDLANWPNTSRVIEIKKDLDQDLWPTECRDCQSVEQKNRGDSMRLNANNAYQHYQEADIVLEVRPGSTCNFACQTCWPQASSRVAQYYRQSKIDFKPAQNLDWEFDRLRPIKHRLKDVIVLGGEPFYDKRCLKFFEWLDAENINANLTIFTNGSTIDREFLKNRSGKVILVFSIDAVGSAASYIRVGTDWATIEENYNYCRQLPNVECRINVTFSPYNYYHLPDTIEWIAKDWPSVVSFGRANTVPGSFYMDESVFPLAHRPQLIDRINTAVKILQNSEIESMQKINAINAMQATITNLETMIYDEKKHQRLVSFIGLMDQAKNLDINDYCPETARCLDINPTRLDKFSPVFLTSER